MGKRTREIGVWRMWGRQADWELRRGWDVMWWMERDIVGWDGWIILKSSVAIWTIVSNKFVFSVTTRHWRNGVAVQTNRSSEAKLNWKINYYTSRWQTQVSELACCKRNRKRLSDCAIMNFAVAPAQSNGTFRNLDRNFLNNSASARGFRLVRRFIAIKAPKSYIEERRGPGAPGAPE